MKAITTTADNKRLNPKWITGAIDSIKQFSVDKFPKHWNNGIELQGADYETQTDERHALDGFHPIVKPPKTEYQRLINFHFDVDKFTWNVEDFTQQEIDDADDAKIDNDTERIISDGTALHTDIRKRIRKKFKKGNLTPTQYQNIKDSLRPAIKPLIIGDWDIAQTNVNALPIPANAKLLEILDKVKELIDTYISENDI